MKLKRNDEQERFYLHLDSYCAKFICLTSSLYHKDSNHILTSVIVQYLGLAGFDKEPEVSHF